MVHELDRAPPVAGPHLPSFARVAVQRTGVARGEHVGPDLRDPGHLLMDQRADTVRPLEAAPRRKRIVHREATAIDARQEDRADRPR